MTNMRYVCAPHTYSIVPLFSITNVLSIMKASLPSWVVYWGHWTAAEASVLLLRLLS